MYTRHSRELFLPEPRRLVRPTMLRPAPVVAMPVAPYVISFINQVSSPTAVSSLTATGSVPGDFLLLFDCNPGTSIPALQSGMNDFTNNTQASAGGGSDCAVRVSYKFATSYDESVPSANATSGCAVVIYRGVHPTNPIQAGSFVNGNAASLPIPARTFSPDAWCVAFGFARDSTPNALTVPGTLTGRHSEVLSNGQRAVADSNAAIASFSTANFTSGAGKYVVGSFGLTPAL